MLLSKKFRLYPSKQQEEELEKHLELCRQVYNHFLEQLNESDENQADSHRGIPGGPQSAVQVDTRRVKGQRGDDLLWRTTSGEWKSALSRHSLSPPPHFSEGDEIGRGGGIVEAERIATW